MKNIIIAGSGLGGLTAGGILAKNGYNVVMYSDCTRETHGYDWADCMSIALLEKITGKKIPQSDYRYIADTRHHSPSDNADMSMRYTDENRPQLIERKVLSEYLIDYAEESGVRIVWNTPVTAALVENGRVTGVKTADGDKFADLVIDACGMFSPVRESLPDECLVERKIAPGEAFYVYRGIYKRNIKGKLPDYPYEVYLLHQYEAGISWHVTEEDTIDILIGRFVPFGQEKIDSVLSDFEPKHPELTRVLVHGGQYANISVRRPLVKMVCDGYAAIGDSAYMTIPMIGSGIDLALNAAGLLAETVMSDRAGKYSTRTLWSYNYSYIMQYGADLVPVDLLKNTLLSMNPYDVDFLLNKGVITENELSSDGSKMPVAEMLKKLINGAPRMKALLEIAGAAGKGGKNAEIYRRIPENYTREGFLKWKRDIDKTIKRIEVDTQGD